MRIPPEIIEEVRNTANIVDVIGDYVPLKRVGKNYVALCPFHQEDTPSFTVNEEKQIFHCFGCGIGGNVFTFIMRYKECSFYEAVKEIANRYGIFISKISFSLEEEKKYQHKKQLFFINKKAAEIYHHFLLKHPLAEEARNYLRKRGIKSETISDYSLGYALPQWDILTRFFKSEKIDIELALESGLIIEKEGKIYDRFRNRIIFPIFNEKGEVIAFGGRVLDDSLPKYINSPETPIYKKGHNLYGYHIARPWCQKEGKVLVVEGYFDLISLHASGIKNVVATLGTALTPMQARLLKQLASKIVLVYDADTAGQKAALRALPILLKEGLKIEILILPEGDDPDSFVQREGENAFLRLINKAEDILEWYFYSGEKETRSDLNLRYQFLKEAMDIISLLKNPLSQFHYRDKLCHIFGVNSSILPSIAKKDENNANFEEILPPFEKNVVKFLLHFPNYIPQFVEEHVLEVFKHQELRFILEKMIETYEKKGRFEVSEFIIEMDERSSSLISQLSVLNDVHQDPQNVVQGLLQQLKQRHFKALLRRIKEAEEKKDWQQLLNLLQKKNHLAYDLKRS